MTSRFRLAFTLARIVVHVLVALFIVATTFPMLSKDRQHRLIGWWSRRVLAIFRIELRVIGANTDPIIDRAMRPGGIGAMLVLNHISWLDIYVVHAVRTARFVAKSEISRWPLIGYLTDRTGAIFIERGRRHAVREVNHRVAEMLRAGDLIGMFPEGTTSEGDRLLPFHANLMQPAIDAGAPIVIAGLRYREVAGGPTAATSYVGDVSLVQSMLRIARHGPLVAELHLIASMDGSTTTRHEVGRRARTAIAAALGLEDDAREALEGLSTVIATREDGVVTRPDAALPGSPPGTQFDPRDELL
jgi:1-acyl-sn-glycerol-3-phosphate acyltransferase